MMRDVLRRELLSPASSRRPARVTWHVHASGRQTASTYSLHTSVLRSGRNLLHCSRRARLLRELAADPEDRPGTSDEAKGFLADQELCTQLALLQQQHNERNSAIAAHQKKQNPCSGPFAIGMRRDRRAFVISNAQLCEFMAGGKLDKKKDVMLNNVTFMNFPVHREADKGRSGQATCSTVSSWCRHFEGPLADFMDEHPNVQMAFTVAVDFIPWPMKPGAGKKPDSLLW